MLLNDLKPLLVDGLLQLLIHVRVLVFVSLGLLIPVVITVLIQLKWIVELLSVTRPMGIVERLTQILWMLALHICAEFDTFALPLEVVKSD